MISGELAVPDGTTAFDLTTRLTSDGRRAIVLHLFRDGHATVTTTIATVAQRDAADVLMKCRRLLERRGIARIADTAAASIRPKRAGRAISHRADAGSD